MTYRMMNELRNDVGLDHHYSYSNDEAHPFLVESDESTSSRMFIAELLKKLSPSIKTGVLGIAGAILVAVGALLVVYMPQLIRHVVLKETVLSEDSQTYKIWEHPNFPLLLEIRIFNITNYEEYTDNKAKPILKEVGPYVYSQSWLKNKIVFHENDSVSYVQNKTFFFERQLSSGSEDDVVYTINMPMLSGASMFKNAGPVLKVVMTTVFTVTHESLVVNTTVKQLIWDGWDDPILKALHQILPNAKYPFTRFAYFYKKNGSHEGHMTVNTGKDDYHKYNLIDRWNGIREIDKWAGPKCNKIQGTPGDLYPPDRDQIEPLTFFFPDFCRSFDIPYAREVERYGLRSYRYEADHRLFANASENPDNACYCHGNCLPSGATNISSCVFDAPIALSLPHFLHGDPRYLEQVSGLKPNNSLHNLYIVLEPKTGIILDINVRFQVNAVLENIHGISQFEKVKNTVFPVFWVTQTAKLTPEIIQLVRIGSSTAYVYGQVATYSIIGAGCLFLFVALGYAFYQRRASKVSEF